MDEPQDEQMGEVEEKVQTLPLSADERRVLELYDRYQQLQLEIAIMKAQSSIQLSTVDDSPEGLASAQDALLDARARYKLRNDAVELVMTADPILKAVHGGTNASPIDRDLLPLVRRRDDAAVDVARSASDVSKVRRELTDVQAETIRACRRNIDLTTELFDLAGELKERKAVDLSAPAARQKMQDREAEMRASRRGWRVMKGVASGIVAGSGVDWADDETLRGIVLDPENED
ncbi:hypothetical protein K4F52_008311 [Lecanicillium sp. MT-2017a]|nr:hypothetical protein K4F52_008311 [Lecanicillium sp. MT-2017a]